MSKYKTDYSTSHFHDDKDEKRKASVPRRSGGIVWGKAPGRTEPRSSQAESPAPPVRSEPRKQSRARTSAPARRDERYVLGVEVSFPGFARVDLPPPSARTRPEDHPYARTTSRIRRSARIGYCLDYGSRKDDPLPEMGVLVVNPDGQPQRAEVQVPQSKHLDELEGIILWPQMAGEGAFIGSDGLARGRIRIDRSDIHEDPDVWTQGLRAQVQMIAGVPMYMADEMNRNAQSAVVRQLTSLNDRANAIYDEYLRDARRQQLSRLDLTTAKHDHGWFSVTDVMETGNESQFHRAVVRYNQRKAKPPGEIRSVF